MDAQRLKSTLLNAAIGAYETLAPVPAGSRLEEGMLTPAECHVSSALPLDKQALVCKGVRSMVRARSLMPPELTRTGEGGFTEVPAHWGPTEPGPEEQRHTASPPMSVASLLSNWAYDPEDDEGMDVSAFALPVVSPGLRLYDVSLVYSRFYRTPAFFLTGADGSTGEALTPEELLQDVHENNAGTTATIEAHPAGLFGGRPCISIHPCRHATVMARALAREVTATASGRAASFTAEDPRLSLYLPAFIKILGSACPSLAGDWTR